jgi:hypothetical protein
MSFACLPRHRAVAYLFLVRSYGAILSNMKNTLKIRLLFVLLVSVALLAAFAAQPDQRFDGVWVGTEGYYFLGGVGIGTGIVVSKNATVIIAQGGSMVAIVGGHFGKPQRFTGHWTKEGLTIYLGEGRTSENKTDHITFSLSADGKLVEKGGARFGLFANILRARVRAWNCSMPRSSGLAAALG